MDLSSTPNSSAKLQQLSDEVNRIAATLARLAVNSGESTEKQNAAANDRQVAAVHVDDVRKAIQCRRLRADYFDPDLFADPAWRILLDLLQAELAQLRTPVSALCIASNEPSTTALRWINVMVQANLLHRRPDPRDARRIFIELTPAASEAMRSYFLAASKLMHRPK